MFGARRQLFCMLACRDISAVWSGESLIFQQLEQPITKKLLTLIRKLHILISDMEMILRILETSCTDDAALENFTVDGEEWSPALQPSKNMVCPGLEYWASISSFSGRGQVWSSILKVLGLFLQIWRNKISSLLTHERNSQVQNRQNFEMQHV